MKTNNILKITKWSILFLFVISFTSCATYGDLSKTTESNLLNSNFQSASASLEGNKVLQKKRNRLLYLLEKGKLEHLNQNYERSNQLLEEAYYLIEDRGKNTGAKVAAAFTNPEAVPYDAEDFEKTTLHYYKALNFYQLGQYDNALVEAKRINIKLNRLNENYKKGKNKYDEDAFAHTLQAIIYEAQGNLNDAFIAYRNAADCYTRNNNAYFGVQMPLQLQKDVVRTAALLGFGQEQRKYEDLFGIQYDGARHESEAIVFWENGLGPQKDQTRISLTAIGGAGVGTFENEELGIVVPIPAGANLGITAVAFPKYVERDSYYGSASITSGSVTEKLQTAESFDEIAKQCLKDRMGREIKDVIIRVVTKKAAGKGLKAIAKQLGGDLAGDLVGLAADGVNAATEKADTRNWQSLPGTISYARVPVKGGAPITMNFYGNKSNEQITLETKDKKGIQIFNHVNFGREVGSTVTNKEIDPNLITSGTTNYQDANTQDASKEQISAQTAVGLGAITNAMSREKPQYSSLQNDNNDFKRQMIGIGVRGTFINGLTVVEPEFTVYNNDKKWGASISYGFGLSYEETPYFDYERVSGNILVGLSDSYGFVLEFERSVGSILFIETSSIGGGVGGFYKGLGRRGSVAGAVKVIVGYDVENRDSTVPNDGTVNDSLSSVYASVGYIIFF